ncbi:membrane protein insertase YidC [Inconstantimicrobium mannanitabidum]|uniref:Membrane protein insertase YidC n=1 Tax=Inconstantimicrobium mannanitabidum TaxID=1604901 RepID=A0ACB5RH66_9CLOT|nr:membrane protein insertase YidC [Clostridium sp. TW13]GKX68441.1 membrane protein insertase YidC [Clostridium sp. TW13]
MIDGIRDVLVVIFKSIHSGIVSIGITNVGTSYVLAIFILTLIVRMLILPLYIKQMKSTAGMQAIQPELKKLQDKYKNDPQKLQEKTMQLYKDNNVSMFGGCLPMIIQLPIIWALYRVFMNIPELTGASFLWIPNLNSYDPRYILPVLSAAATYVQSWLMTSTQPSGQQAGGMNMGTMNIVTAVMMGAFAMKLGASIVLYWIMGSLILVVQTYFLNVRPAKKKKLQVDGKK